MPTQQEDEVMKVLGAVETWLKATIRKTNPPMMQKEGELDEALAKSREALAHIIMERGWLK